MTPLLGRLGISASIFAALALWELSTPARRYAAPRLRRWAANIGLQLVNGLLLAAAGAAPPLFLMGVARWAERRGLGLLNLTRWDYALKFALSFAILDLAVWAQHWAFHLVPPLWRLHRVHHTDVDLDVTTGFRFHPGEIAVSLGVKAAVVVGLGAHFLAVAAFETVLNAASLFTHANARVPFGLEPWLRRLIVTPDMHRVHHSVAPAERDSNFGFCLSWWDRLAGTYEPEPAAGPLTMTLGLPETRDASAQTLPWLLKQPFSK